MAQFPRVTIHLKDTSAVIVPERGGILTNFLVDGKEIFYLDQSTVDDPEKNIRGGIPLLFPQAGPLPSESKYQLKQHGFARNLPWEVIINQENTLSLQLRSNSETKKLYPFDFCLIEEIKIEEKSLVHKVSIKNEGSEKMPTAFGTHPYFFIPNNQKYQFTTSIPQFLGPFTKGNPTLDWDIEQTLVFDNPGEFEIYLEDKTIKVTTDKSKLKRLMVWWQPGKNFVCFEPWFGEVGVLENMDQCQWVNPAQTIEYQLKIQVTLKD